MSAITCGCDPEARWQCEWHRLKPQIDFGFSDVRLTHIGEPIQMLPTEDQVRKQLPVFDGVLMYFPDAITAVSAVSKAGNDQHNPGEPLHWARGKSMDQMNTALRHMMDHGTGNHMDTDGTWHLAKAAWRILAALQLAIEAEQKNGK